MDVLRVGACVACGIGAILALGACCADAGKSSTCGSGQAGHASGGEKKTDPRFPKLDISGLSNVYEIRPGVYSGSSPSGREDFEELRRLGVKAVISVDGGRPEVEAAREAGIRYIHIPVSYHGIDRAQQLMLAKALRETHGAGERVYVHCHHGKHRGPTAAVMGLVLLGEMSCEEARDVQVVAGTSPSYPGLYECVAEARELTKEEIDSAGELMEVAKVSGIVESMTEIDQVWENLTAIRKAGWVTPKDHPDLVPTAEAGRLSDLFRMLGQDESVAQQPEAFRTALSSDSTRASEIEQELVKLRGTRPGSGALKSLEDGMEAIGSSCAKCHGEFRNRRERGKKE